MLSSAFDGKTTQRYMRSHRIELPRARQGWSIRLRRITPNANSNTIADRTFIDSVTEVIDAKLRYPMSAVVGIKINASQFQSIPTRAYHVRGRIIRVPANYDPELRSYSGVWDGTFKLAWTNNPAWVFHDLISNDRYGLGTRVPAGWLDKWGLYQIGRYCDEMVDDGFGGKEPRFTCNVYLQQAADAYRVVQDFASIFRGMAYWANASVFAAADMPSDPVYTYSSANVVDGKFSYVGSALGTRYTVALVSWNDLSEMGRQKVEYVENREGIARYGIQQVEVTGFGCTSRGQAHRVGKWMLLTSNRKRARSRSRWAWTPAACVPAASSASPISIWPAAASAAASRGHDHRGHGGRGAGRASRRPADRQPAQRRVRDACGGGRGRHRTHRGQYRVHRGHHRADRRPVGLPGSVLHITVTAPFSQAPQAECVWTLESEALSAQTFRVLAVKRKEGLVAEISAIQHEPGKFDNVDFGTRLDPKPITVVPPSVQAAPQNIRLASRSVIDQGIARHVAEISWAAAPSAVAYHVQWRRDNSDWVEAGRTGSLTLELPDIRAGAYVARVRAINVADVSSVWASSTETQLQGDRRRRRRWPSWPHNRRCSALACAGDFRKDASPRSAPRSGTARPMTAPARSSWGFRLSAERAHPVRPVGRQALFFWGRIVALNGEIGAGIRTDRA